MVRFSLIIKSSISRFFFFYSSLMVFPDLITHLALSSRKPGEVSFRKRAIIECIKTSSIERRCENDYIRMKVKTEKPNARWAMRVLRSCKNSQTAEALIRSRGQESTKIDSESNEEQTTQKNFLPHLLLLLKPRISHCTLVLNDFGREVVQQLLLLVMTQLARSQ